MKLTIKIIVGVVLAVGVAFGLEMAGLEWTRFFAPRREAVRREVFKSTRSYNEGKEQQLIKLRLEWMQADEVGKGAIASTIRHSFADYDEGLIDSPELRAFLKRMKYAN